MNKTLLALIVVFITATSIYSQPPTKNSWNNKNRKKPTKKIKEFIPKKGKGYVIVSAFLDKNKKLYSSSSLLYRKINTKDRVGSIQENSPKPSFGNGEKKDKLFMGSENLSINVLELNPGIYEFYKWRLYAHPYEYLSRNPSSYKFEVKQNELIYVGNINFHLTGLYKYFGYKFASGGFAEIKDEFKRDTTFFRTKFTHFEEMKIVKNNIKRNEFQYQSKKENIGYNYKFESDSVGILSGTIIQDFEAGFSTFMYFNGELETDVIVNSSYKEEYLKKFKKKNDTIPEFKKTYFFIELPMGEYTIDEFRIIDEFDSKYLGGNSVIELFKSHETNIKFTIKPKVINYLGEIKTEVVEEDKNITDIELKFFDKFEEMDSLLNDNSISKFNITNNENDFENTEKVIFHKIERKN